MMVRFANEPIAATIKEQEEGGKAADVCWRHWVSEGTLYKIQIYFPELLHTCIKHLASGRGGRIFFGFGANWKAVVSPCEVLNCCFRSGFEILSPKGCQENDPFGFLVQVHRRWPVSAADRR
jgi:hypothetical protein